MSNMMMINSMFVILLFGSHSVFGYVEALAANTGLLPASHFEPQVAFRCDEKSYHTKYMNESGEWIDDLTNKRTCLVNKVDILEYCKKVYPDKVINNIVESTHTYKISKWCKEGRKQCKGSAWIKPFRCLEGVFQSDALLVPEGCQFDHVHNQSQCREFDDWNRTALTSCSDRNMELKSFAMLLPCGIDVFQGVEFVCCPRNRNTKIETTVTDPTPDLEDLTRDEYFTHFDPRKEHKQFKAAEERLEEHHREKVTQVMKEWSELEEKYQEMKLKDPATADAFKKKMTLNFQKKVKILEDEQTSEKQQIVSMHQQRAMAHINKKKKDAIMCYHNALNQDVQNVRRVEKCLEKLLRSLQKDRHHTLTHYKHLLNTNLEQADKERVTTLSRLQNLDETANHSLDMLTNFPELAQKLRPVMEDYIEALKQRDSLPHELLSVPGETSETILQRYRDEVVARQRAKERVEKEIEEKKMKHQQQKKEQHLEKKEYKKYEDVTAEKVHEPVVSHVETHSVHHEAKSFVMVNPVAGEGNKSVYVTMAFAGVALLGALVIAIIVLRRRNNPHSKGFREVNQAATPEERHVASMQVNGYENPTYRYFETQEE